VFFVGWVTRKSTISLFAALAFLENICFIFGLDVIYLRFVGAGLEGIIQ
jgi:hypothetical protein